MTIQSMQEYAELHGFDRDHPEEPADEKPAPEQPLGKCYNCGEDYPVDLMEKVMGRYLCPVCSDQNWEPEGVNFAY